MPQENQSDNTDNDTSEKSRTNTKIPFIFHEETIKETIEFLIESGDNYETYLAFELLEGAQNAGLAYTDWVGEMEEKLEKAWDEA